MKKISISLCICLISFISFTQNSELNLTQSNSQNAKSDGIDIGTVQIQSPLSDYCGFDLLEPEVWYKNMGTETVNSFTASYRLDFYPLVVSSIEETILPGDSVLVTFDAVTVPAGNHSIQFGCSSPNGTTDSDPSNNSRSLSFNYSNGTHVLISIMTDNYGNETSWTLKNAANETVASGSNYANSTLNASLLCLPAGCYTFTINDSFGDGICAGYGDGYYLIENVNDETEIATGCDFNDTESAVFCIEFPTGLPLANLTHSQPNNCSGEVSFFDISSCNPTAESWLWNFGDGSTSTEQNPVHTYLSNGYYNISLQISNSIGNSTITVPNSVIIEKYLPPLVTDLHFCFGENVNFSSPNKETFEWYTSANGTTPDLTGSYISFANLQHDTTVYYQYFEEPEYYNFGLVDNSGLGGFFNFSIDRAVYFDALSDVTISKATVFASGAASRTFTLKNSGGTVLDTRVINIPDGESIIELNFEVPAGNDYAIHVNTANNLSYTGDYGGPDVGYPFTVPGIISIIANNYSNSFWYFFYNIEVFQGFGDGCISSREPANAILSPQSIDLGEDTTVCNGQGLILNAGSFVEYEWSTGSENQEIEVTESGDYFITATDQYSCVASGDINISIAAELVFNLLVTHPSEIGADDGSIEIEIISGSEPYEIVWSNSETDFTISNLAPNMYYYTITDYYECEHTGQIEIFSSVGINNNIVPNFEIFPNPAFDKISIYSQKNIKSVLITGVNGNEIIKTYPRNISKDIDVSYLPSGIYFIIIDTGEELARKKLIITK